MSNYNSFTPRATSWTNGFEDVLLHGTKNHFQDSLVKKPAIETSKRTNEKKGLTVLQTAIFITGEMAGSGVLALPKAIVTSGWIGLVLIVVFCVNAAHGGVRLGQCWQMLEERYPEYRNKTRNPYATIAYKAVGKWASVLVSGCIQFTLFGAGTVYLLLASQIFQELFNSLLPSLSFCTWFIFLAIFVAPLMWLGSPKDFQFAGVIATLTTVVACLLYFTQIIIDGLTIPRYVEHDVHNFHDFFLAFGVLLFAYGGASTFPTIQNDMENRSKFSISVIIAFSVVLLLYVPIAAGGFYVYGEAVSSNIVLSLSETTVVTFANILMAVHLLFAFLIVINPVCQELEEIFGIPHHYNWKRCVIRGVMIILMVCVGETIPKFGKILALVGGSTATLLTFVFPSYFYMKLCEQSSPLWSQRFIPGYLRLYMWELILLGLIGGTAATYNAIIEIFDAHSFTRPCYWS